MKKCFLMKNTIFLMNKIWFFLRQNMIVLMFFSKVFCVLWFYEHFFFMIVMINKIYNTEMLTHGEHWTNSDFAFIYFGVDFRIGVFLISGWWCFFNDFYDFLKWFLKIFCVIMFFTIGMLRQDLASNGSRPKGLW